MGYRSDVRSIIYGPPDLMLRFVTAMKLDEKYKAVFEHFGDNITIRTWVGETPITVLDLTGDGWKWYTDYPDVNLWHELLAMVETDDTWEGLHYEFCRIGEEDGDIERDGSTENDNLIIVSRPETELDLNYHQMREGFPNETDQISTGEEQAAPATGVLRDAGDGNAD